MHRKWAIAGFVVCLAVGFGWGAVTIKRHVFPYSLMRSAVVPAGPIPTQLASAHIFKKYPRTGDMVFIGDSIFAMVEWQDIFPEKRVVRRAIWGDTSGQMLNRFDAILATKAPVAVIMAGTNDIKNGVSESETLANFRAILRTYPGKLYVVSVIPCGTGDPDCGRKTKLINSLNGKLRQLPNIHFIDVAKTMSSADIADGTHPNTSGLEKIVAGVRAAIPAN